MCCMARTIQNNESRDKKTGGCAAVNLANDLIKSRFDVYNVPWIVNRFYYRYNVIFYRTTMSLQNYSL